MPILWDKTLKRDRLEDVGRDVAQALLTAPAPFCVWLNGTLGAGKTTTSGAILRALGLAARVPVTSPTFTYMNEYKLGTKWYAHLDLYRAGESFSLEDLGLVDSRPFAGYLVEWPEQIPPNPALAPTHVLAISFGAADDERRYVLEQRSWHET